MVGIGVGEALRKNKGMYSSSYFKMENILQEFIQIIDHIDWSSLITLRRCSELLRIKIELLEDSIPDYIDDDWWNQPQRILLSYKLRMLRCIHSKVLKCIEDVETDNLQHAQNPDEDQVICRI